MSIQPNYQPYLKEGQRNFPGYTPDDPRIEFFCPVCAKNNYYAIIIEGTCPGCGIEYANVADCLAESQAIIVDLLDALSKEQDANRKFVNAVRTLGRIADGYNEQL